MMLQQIRRQPSSRDREEQEEVERSRRIAEYQSRIFERSRSDDKLIEVQEQLLKIFGKLKARELGIVFFIYLLLLLLLFLFIIIIIIIFYFSFILFQFFLLEINV